MAEINFDCPNCGQNLDAPDEMSGEVIECPACGKEMTVPGGIIEIPKTSPKIETPSSADPSRPPIAPRSTPSSTASATGNSDADKGKTVRIELPPEFLDEPEKHIFKIKRIQR